MLSDIPPPTGPGRIKDKELDAKVSVMEVLLFMEKHLEALCRDAQRPRN